MSCMCSWAIGPACQEKEKGEDLAEEVTAGEKQHETPHEEAIAGEVTAGEKHQETPDEEAIAGETADEEAIAGETADQEAMAGEKQHDTCEEVAAVRAARSCS